MSMPSYSRLDLLFGIVTAAAGFYGAMANLLVGIFTRGETHGPRVGPSPAGYLFYATLSAIAVASGLLIATSNRQGFILGLCSAVGFAAGSIGLVAPSPLLTGASLVLLMYCALRLIMRDT